MKNQQNTKAAPLKIAIAGLGTVGKGVYKILTDNAKIISERSGRKVEIVAVSSRDKSKNRGIDLGKIEWFENAVDLASLENVDVIVELIGGAKGVAHDLCKKAIKNGKHVVTANKALISKHGFELAELAEKHNVTIAFEASVAGGIPILKSIREGFAGNKFKKIFGILNGTCNFILTKMKNEGRGFRSVLEEAQQLGYAEADPTFDVDGIDAGHKLSILSALAFGIKPNFENVFCEGIRKITAEDIKYAGSLGYNIKLLGIACAKKVGNKTLLEQRVHPCLLEKSAQIGNIDGVLGAVFVDTDSFGKGLFVGAGAGELPTASAVVADIIDIASGRINKPFGVAAENLKDGSFSSIEDHEGEYYLRLRVKDQDGVLSSVTSILAKNKIGFEKVHQEPITNEKAPESKTKEADIILITHNAAEKLIRKSITALDAQKYLTEEPVLIRVERV
jgi:homoserine dehydrogenase